MPDVAAVCYDSVVATALAFSSTTETLLLLDGAKASAARQLQIFNGSEVTTEAYPFVAFLVDSKLKHLCTGSLVSPGVILTAAHCFSRHDRVYDYDNKGFKGGAKEERDFHESYRVILGRNVAGSGNVSDAIEVEKIVIGEVRRRSPSRLSLSLSLTDADSLSSLSLFPAL